jgi:diacylglycerol kinase (ATP)
MKDAHRSPLAQMGRGSKINISFDRPTMFELDGGARKAKKKFRASIEPGAIRVCVPNEKEE